ncbi:MAG: PilZ domain-containing protein [Acidobacteriia bacterium]|nr:PilZ domain-containing protein [Terriglobia bacterium]
METQSSRGRRPGRYPFVAEVRATDLASGKQVYGETEDLSKGGCCIRTREPLRRGSLIQLEIKKGEILFVTRATVAYSLEAKAMGAAFLNVPSEQMPILAGWLQAAIPTLRRNVKEEQPGSGAADALLEKPETIGD